MNVFQFFIICKTPRSHCLRRVSIQKPASRISQLWCVGVCVCVCVCVSVCVSLCICIYKTAKIWRGGSVSGKESCLCTSVSLYWCAYTPVGVCICVSMYLCVWCQKSTISLPKILSISNQNPYMSAI